MSNRFARIRQQGSLWLVAFGQTVHSENGFSRLHKIELISGKKLQIARITLQQSELLTLFIIERALASDRFLQRLNGALLLLSLSDERQKPANQKDQNGDN